MSQRLTLKYGDEKISIDLPDQTEIFHLNEPETRITPQEFESRLSQELERLNPDLSNIAIVVGDKTRLCGYKKFLPILIATLENFGAAPASITVFIAYGAHPRQTDDACLAAYGDTYHKIRFVHHDCRDTAAFANMGKTSRGTPVLIRRDIVDAGFLITFGSISHHYFAGYGGGRKLIFPGLGHRESIYHNHGLFLDPARQTLSSACRSGVLDGNPLAEDLAEFETFRPADLAVHGILDGGGHVRDLLPGVGTDHFHRACADYGKIYETAAIEQFDLVIASCGGYPKDINFIQSHKTIDNAAKFVRNGGRLIVLAECSDGVGSETFLPWFEMGDWQKAFDKLAANYEGNGGTALSMMSKLKRIKVFMVTDLNRLDCDIIGVEKMSVDQAKMTVKQFSGSVAAIPSAGMLVKVPKGF